MILTSPPYLTLVISLLSGKAVWPLVSKPQMTVSCGQVTKGVQVESLLGRVTLASLAHV